MPINVLKQLTIRHPRLVTGLTLFVVLLIAAGDPVAAVSNPTGDVYIGP